MWYILGMTHEEEARQAFEKGTRLGETGDWAAALAACDRAIALRPNLAEVWAFRAAVLGELERYQEALEGFDQAVKRNPDFAEAWAIRGFDLTGLGRYQEAVTSYDEALKHRPDFRKAWEGRMLTMKALEMWLKERLPPKPHVEAFELVAFIEERLHMSIRQRLQQTYGKEEQKWWPQVPLLIRKKCAERREEDPRRRSLYNYTDLLDLKDIMDKHWKLFEADFQKVKGQVESKREFLGSLERLNEVRKEVMHPVRGGLTDDDLAFAHRMREVVENFAPLE